MSGAYDSGICVTELSEYDDGTNIVAESLGPNCDKNDHSTVFSTYTSRQKDNTQYPKFTKNQKSPREVCECSKSNDRATRFSLSSLTDGLFTTERLTKTLQCQLLAILVITICIITLLSVVPIVLYTINPPRARLHSIEVDAFYPLNFDTCSVSIFVYLFITLYRCIKLHRAELQDCEVQS